MYWKKQRKVKKNFCFNKKGNYKNISYKTKFIDSARFLASSLSNLIDYLTKGIHKTKCKNCDCFLEYKCVEGNLIINVYLAINVI